MNLFPKILKNTILQIIGKILSVFLGIVSISLITRSLGPEYYGYYTTILNYLLISSVILDAGLHLTMVQLVSKYHLDKKKQESIIHNVLSLKLVISIIVLIASVFIAFLMPYPMIVKTGIALIAIAVLINAFIQILTGIFQIHLAMQAVVKAEILRFLLNLIAISVFFKLNLLNIYVILFISIFVYIINLLFLYLYSKKYFQIKFSWDISIIKEILLFTWPLALSTLFNLLYLRTDVLILSLSQSPEDVAMYGLAYKFLDILTMMSPLLMGVLLPVLTREWVKHDLKAFQYYFQQSFNLFVILAFPIVFGTQLVADKLILLLSDADFLMAGEILKILIFAVIALFVGGLSTYTIVALNEQKKMLWVYAFTAIISLLLYIIYIPQYSYWAASIITIISEFIILFTSYIIVLRKTKISLNFIVLIKVLLASLLMYFILDYLNLNNLFLIILIAMCIYTAELFLFKVLDKKSILNLRKQLKM